MPPKPPSQPEKDPLALSLLTRAHSPTTASSIYTSKITHRPVYLKPTSSTPNAQLARRHARAHNLAARKKQKPAPLSARQKRSLDLYTIPPSSQKHSIYVPLHKLWVGYIHEILCLTPTGGGLPVTGPAAAKLCSADYHGCELEVVRSKCVGRVGIRGIVVRDMRGVFEVITSSDVLKTVPKEGTVFRFKIPLPVPTEEAGKESNENREAEGEEKEKDKTKELVFELHGSQFQYRAADRANRKFKSHFLPDL